MAEKDLSKEELEKIVERQEAIIANYEAVSGFYRKVKNLPLVGKTARVAAGVLKSNRRSATKIINNIKDESPELIGVCNPHFSRGVRSATYSIASNVIEISDLFSQREVAKATETILKYRPKKVLISGYSIGYEQLAESLKKKDPKVRIFVLIHSAFGWFDYYPTENPVFEKMLKLTKQGVVEKIGFCKNDLAEYFKSLGYNAYFVMNRMNFSHGHHKLNKEKIKIGIWGSNWWHRNILNQVIGALMVPNTEIHVNEVSDHGFVDRKRLVVHGFMEKEKYEKVFSEMDINMYVSLTDCFPMTLIESMELGIPCLASDTSDVYSFESKLKERMVVSAIDSPIAISKKIKETLKNYSQIQKEIKAYLPVLDKKITESIGEFLT